MLGGVLGASGGFCAGILVRAGRILEGFCVPLGGSGVDSGRILVVFWKDSWGVWLDSG